MPYTNDYGLLVADFCRMRGLCMRCRRRFCFLLTACAIFAWSSPNRVCKMVLRKSFNRVAALPMTVAQVARQSTWHKPGIAVQVPNVVQHKVEEKIVNITFVNYAGERKKLPGTVGESLLAVAKRFNYEHVDGACGGGGSPADVLHKEGQWYEPKYGEGPQCYHCHVIIPKSHAHHLVPKRPEELELLCEYPFPEDMTDTSRLACQVTVTKEMEGMVVYVPDGPPSDIP